MGKQFKKHGYSAKLVRVVDGDTIRVEWSERDFDFPVRIA